MLKKNQLVLILLTLVLMLSVYFIRSPFKENNTDNPDDGGTVETTGRLEELQALRLTLNEERTKEVLSLDAIIASSDKTVDEKNSALEEKRYLNSLTEKELLLEVQIMNNGYRDAFVHATESGVDITVISNSNSLTIANEIIVMALSGFGDITSDVSVNFQTAEEVMGKPDNESLNVNNNLNNNYQE